MEDFVIKTHSKNIMWKKGIRTFAGGIILVMAMNTLAPTVQAAPYSVIDAQRDNCAANEKGGQSDLPNSSVDSWELVLVNRDNKKPEMNPDLATVGNIQVDKRIEKNVQDLLAEAQKIDPSFHLISGYRSVAYQEQLYESYVQKEMGTGLSKEEAEKKVQTYSQPPGASEHQTGLALDISTVDSLNEMPKEKAEKLKQVAEKLGFVRRFESDKSGSTGVGFEDWHFRYVGAENAAYMNKKNLSLEEYVELLKNRNTVSSSGASSSSGGSSASDPSLGDAGGNWLVEGTEEYKVAEAVYKILTEVYGLSGTSAAGVMGNIQSESGFAANSVEAENGQNYSGRGYGLYQFTPGEKYLNSPLYKKGAPLLEEVKNQTEFVFADEFRNGKYVDFLPNGQKWFGIQANSIDDVFDQNDVEKATLLWFAIYERGSIPHMHRERRLTAAKKANEVFNKSNAKADKSKWPINGGEPNGTVSTTSTNGASKVTDSCEPTKVSSGGSAVDGTGTVPSDAGYNVWKSGDLPESLKKYAHPENKSKIRWKENSGQCVDYSNSYGSLLWGDYFKRGDGGQVAQNWAEYFGNSIKDTPKAGAIFSSNDDPTYGHTGVVEHVFENGDILISEQNYRGVSGVQGAGINTYDYRTLSPSQYKALGFRFAYPDNKEPNWNGN